MVQEVKLKILKSVALPSDNEITANSIKFILRRCLKVNKKVTKFALSRMEFRAMAYYEFYQGLTQHQSNE